ALVVPGLVATGPMQWIAEFELLARLEAETALPALIFWPAVPGSAERLITPARKRDQILLQRIDPKRVGDRIIVQCTVGAVGADHQVVAVAEECSRDPEMLELCAGEVAEHRCLGGFLHC